ncbi:MAG: hypothetical protein ACREPC_01440 [Stenotrophomonas sp.]|uniref:hypothetical protein n=1 Tax=Stenotrophomonas sp. TaxID=69392 RepID=UPI003D6D0BE1
MSLWTAFFLLVRIITYKATIMENIIRNGDFSSGLSHWKANKGVDTAVDGGRHYAYFGKGVGITQELHGMEGGAKWLLRFEVAEYPLKATAWRTSMVRPPTLELPRMQREVPLLEAQLALLLFDGTTYWHSIDTFDVYPSWGMVSRSFDAPKGCDVGDVSIMLYDFEGQPDRSMAIRGIELFKPDWA